MIEKSNHSWYNPVRALAILVRQHGEANRPADSPLANHLVMGVPTSIDRSAVTKLIQKAVRLLTPRSPRQNSSSSPPTPSEWWRSSGSFH
jgi:hypothetical protein